MKIGDGMGKKGFTLFEVLSVLVILGLLGAIIYPKINKTIKNSEINTSKLSAQSLVDGLVNYVLDKKATLTSFDGCSYDFSALENDCGDFSFNGKKPNEGVLDIDSDGNVSGYVVFGKHRYTIINNKAFYSKVYVFEYTDEEQFLKIEDDGYYKLEVWGASGGSIPDLSVLGGYGGYSSGFVYLDSGKTLYVNVGGKGSDSTSGYILKYDGGYNGGGDGYVHRTTNGSSGAGGGGATHIATVSGELSSLSNNVDDILIVAGGGGGACADTDTGGYNSAGGSGGGYIGNHVTHIINTSCKTGCVDYNYPSGGSQSSGGQGVIEWTNGSTSSSQYVGTFGQGGIATSTYGGGGGGFYGGASGQYNGGAGGSGYIGNELLVDKHMYCYNCFESPDVSTKTIKTIDVSDVAVSNSAKLGNGYAVITYLEEYAY